MYSVINIITEDYVNFETAKLLKEKGFNEFTLHYYAEGHLLKHYSPLTNSDNVGISAPTLQMATKWLREKHNLYIFPFPQINTNKFWAEIYQLNTNQEWENLYCKEIDLKNYSSQEEAAEAAIKYCLENLI